MRSPVKPGFCLLIALAACSFPRIDGLAASLPSNYVVIGAFSLRDNAVRFAAKAQQNNYEATFDLNPARQLYYVFVMQTPDRSSAHSEALRLRKESPYSDAWVFFGVLGTEGSGVDIHPVTRAAIEPEEVAPQVAVVQESPVPVEAETTVVPASTPPATSVASDPNAVSKDFYFKVYRGDGTAADGAEITVIDLGSQKKEYVLAANKNVSFKAVNQSGDIRLECDLVGFRKVIRHVNFKNPLASEEVTVENDRIVVPFELVRLRKGDLSILYNVYFFKDAAIMRPESKFDLDGLLTMMKENANYKIRIHGHTNGSAAGRLLEAGESGNIFTLSGAREGVGSAKKLSEKRALVIRDFLMKEGIDESRLSVKAWGGKKPLYDKHHTQASANVRVEVEVVEE